MINISTDLSQEQLQDIIVEIIHEEDEKPKKRMRHTRVSLEDSVWGIMLKASDIGVEGSFTNKKFRRRFRVPYLLFVNVLVPMCISKNVFDMTNKSFIPIEFKILVCLRILGRDATADDIKELCCIGESTVNYIFKLLLRDLQIYLLTNM